MATLSVSLTKPLKAFVDEQIASGAYGSASAFLAALVQAERKRKAEEKLLALVKEGDDSGPAGPMTAQDWERIRKAVAEGIPQQKKRPARKR